MTEVNTVTQLLYADRLFSGFFMLPSKCQCLFKLFVVVYLHIDAQRCPGQRVIWVLAVYFKGFSGIRDKAIVDSDSMAC